MIDPQSLEQGKQWLKDVAHHPFPIACSFTSIALAALPTWDAIDSVGRPVEIVWFGASLIPVLAWIVARAFDLFPDAKGDTSGAWRVANLGALALVTVVTLLVFGLQASKADIEDGREQAQLALQEIRTAQAEFQIEIVGTVAPVASQIAAAGTAAAAPRGEVLPSTIAPSGPTVKLVEGICGADVGSRLDVSLPGGLRAGSEYWLLRSDEENPQQYAVGPPRKRDHQPELTFYVPLPICGRTYHLQTLECDSAGDADLRAAAAISTEAVVERLPAGCVVIAESDARADK